MAPLAAASVACPAESPIMVAVDFCGTYLFGALSPSADTYVIQSLDFYNLPAGWTFEGPNLPLDVPPNGSVEAPLVFKDPAGEVGYPDYRFTYVLTGPGMAPAGCQYEGGIAKC